jgi:hypothetical protein
VKTKRHDGMYKDSDEMLFRLFDTGEMEHVCDLVRHLNDPVLNGERTGLSKSLRNNLLAPLNYFIGRLHESGRGINASEYPAADEFRSAVENVAGLLALSEGRSMDVHGASELADDLESSWTRFIAHAAAFRMYDDLPRDLTKQRRRRERNVENSKLGGNATKKKYAKPRLDALIRGCLARGERMPVKAWASEFDKSRQTIYNAIKRIKAES